MIPAIFFILFGGFLTWAAITNWRHRHAERISLIEAIILKATGEEPLPHTWFDRLLQKSQMIFASIFGPMMLILGIAMLIDEIGSHV